MIYDHRDRDDFRLEQTKNIHDEVLHVIRELELLSSFESGMTLIRAAHVVQGGLDNRSGRFYIGKGFEFVEGLPRQKTRSSGYVEIFVRI